MRELKFRAWDKEEGEFINIKSFGILENGEVWYVQAIDENERDIDPPYLTDSDDLVIMQYTGLKDKNGREIYEGDIVGRLVYQETIKENEDGSNSYISHINKDKIWTYGIVTYSDKRVEFITGNSKIWLGRYDDIEVLGNIYENPNLVGDSHE